MRQSVTAIKHRQAEKVTETIQIGVIDEEQIRTSMQEAPTQDTGRLQLIA
jgi:hypothetical protein